MEMMCKWIPAKPMQPMGFQTITIFLPILVPFLYLLRSLSVDDEKVQHMLDRTALVREGMTGRRETRAGGAKHLEWGGNEFSQVWAVRSADNSRRWDDDSLDVGGLTVGCCARMGTETHRQTRIRTNVNVSKLSLGWNIAKALSTLFPYTISKHMNTHPLMHLLHQSLQITKACCDVFLVMGFYAISPYFTDLVAGRSNIKKTSSR